MKKNYSNILITLLFSGFFIYMYSGNSAEKVLYENVEKLFTFIEETKASVVEEVFESKASSDKGLFETASFANEIELVKLIEDTSGNTLNTNVNPGQQLVYSLNYHNSSAATISNYIITDVLPDNLTYVSNDAPGITSYDANTRTVTINVGNLAADEVGEVNITVQVASDIELYRDACTTAFSNQAISNYNGLQEGSYPSVGATTPAPSVFTLNPTAVSTERTEILCGDTSISAGDGFDTYQWTQNGSFVGNTQTITVNNIGTYEVVKTKDCNGTTVSYKETVHMRSFNSLTNPILAYADAVSECVNDGSDMPNILLCGGTTSKTIQTEFQDIQSIQWQTLSGSCSAGSFNCPNTNSSCWTTVSTSNDFTVAAAGEYRLVLTTDGGCFKTYYFKAYTGLNNVQTSSTDYNSQSLGTISITGAGDGPIYTYNLTDGNGLTTTYGPTTDNNYTFTGLNTGTYNLEITTDSGCSYTESITISDNNPLYFEARKVYETKDCNRAKVQVHRGGGDSPYRFAIWSINGEALYDDFSEIPDSEFSNEESDGTGGSQARVFEVPVQEQGYYVFVMKDDSGNYALSNSALVELDPAYQFSLSTENVSCYGGNDGSVSVDFVHEDDIKDSSIALYIENEDGTYTLLGENVDGTYPNLIAGDYLLDVTITLQQGNATCTFRRNFTITQPDAALVAFAGVSSDVSCNPEDNVSEVRITNASGGTPPYQYSFDGGNTWSGNNVGTMASDGYVYIRDANDCLHEMFVDVNDATEIPALDYDTVYDCSGTGTVTINPSVTDPDLVYEYQYSLNGGIPQDSNVFDNLAPGQHTVTVYYENVTPDMPTPGILLAEDFGVGGNTTNDNVNQDYIYESQMGQENDNVDGDSDNMLDDGEYVVTSDLQVLGGQQWYSPTDAQGVTDGRYLAVNIGGTAGEGGAIYEKEIFDIIPGLDVEVDISLYNILYSSSNQADPNIRVELVDASGNVVSYDDTGSINNDEQWHHLKLTLPSVDATNLTFRIRSYSTVFSGNDIAIDGLKVYQTPIICTQFGEIVIDVEEAQGIQAQLIGTDDVSCFGGNDGSATFEVTNFDASTGFVYSTDGGTTWSAPQFSSPIVIENLPAGDVEVIVRDLRDEACVTEPITATITEPTMLTVTADVTKDITCDTTPGATIVATADGGTPAYEYALDDGAGTPLVWQSNNVFENITAGTYTIYVRDANGCQANALNTITLEDPNPVEFTAVPTVCYDGTNGEIVVTVTNGNGDYQFSIDGGTSWFNADATTPNTYTFTNLTPGTYTVNVKDASSCQGTPIDVTINETLTLSATSQSNVDCFGSNNGSAVITVNDFIPPYSYSVNGTPTASGQTSGTINLDNLAPGTYNVEVTDGNGCTADASVTIEGPPATLTMSLDVTPMSCSATPSGSVTVTAADGWGGYEYTLTYPDGTTAGPQSTNVFTGLTQTGTYSVAVTDAGGCTITDTFSLEPATPPTLTLSDSGCYDGSSNVTITANASNGTAPYEYSLNGGAFGSSNTFSVAPGTYTVTVRDALNCTDQEQITIDEELTVTATAGILPACGATASTDIIITAAGGDGNYVYSIDGTNFQSGNTFAVSTPGTYTVYVRDNNGNPVYCEATTQVTITQDNAVDFTENHTDVTCFDGTNGTITLTGSGGTAPYTYQIENTADGIDITNTTGQFVNLPAGDYNVTVTDNNGCTDVGTITITEPAEINATIDATPYTCVNDAAITVNATGGSGSFEYSLNGSAWDSNNVFAGLQDGTHTIRVRDAAATDCFITLTHTIDPLPPVPSLTATVDYSCDGTGTITVLPNDPTYTYQLGAGTPQASNLFTDVAAGSYVITVDYGSECTTTVPVSVQPGEALAADITAVSHVTCNGGVDGSITFNVDNFDPAAGYDYQVIETTGGSTVASGTTETNPSVTINGLAAGDYEIIITDPSDSACSITLTQTISESAALTVAAEVTTEMTCNNGNTAVITATATGGSGNYEFSIDGTTFLSDNTFTVTTAGNYTITVRDVDNPGCTASTPAPIAVDEPELVDFTFDPTLCYSGNNDGTIDIEITSGNGNYSVSLNGGPFVPTNVDDTHHQYTGLTPGTYNITVRDGFGCDVTKSVTIESQLSANAILTKGLDCSVNADGEITVNISGGNPDYVYDVNINGSGYSGTTTAVGAGNTSFVYTFPNPAVTTTYQFQITDSQGCTAETGVITIEPISAPQATHNVTPISCSGNDDGVVNININNSFGTPPYQVNFNGLGFSNQTTYSGLAAGTYSYIVQDANGCTYTDDVTIDPVDPIEATLTKTDVTCNGTGVDPGSVTATITSGGVADFTYTLFDSSHTQIDQVTTSSTSYTFSNIDYGFYYVQIVDANGCAGEEGSINVIADPFLTLEANVTAPDCVTGGSVTLLASTGSGDYDFEIYGSSPLVTPDSEYAGSTVDEEYAVFNGLIPGLTYIFKATDNVNGCISYVEVDIPSISSMTLTLSTTDVLCTAADDGTVTFSVDQYDATTTELKYTILNSVTNTSLGAAYEGNIPSIPQPGPTSDVTVGNLPPGDYVLLIEEVDGLQCTVTETFRITEPTPVDISLIDQTNANCNDGAFVTVRGSGGTGPYEYAFVENGVAPTVTDYITNATSELDPAVNTEWDVWVKDSNGCTDVLDVTIILDPSPIISAIVVDDCVNEGSFAVDVNLTTAGIPPYSISLNGGVFQSASFASGTYQLTGLNSGLNQSVTVRDSNGCLTTANFDIYPPLELNAQLMEGLDCQVGDEDAEIQIEVNGGSSATPSNITYSIDGPAGFIDVSGVTLTANPLTITNANVEGIYTITINDTVTGCSVMTTVTVPPLVEPDPYIDSYTDATCFGVADGSITVGVNDNGYGPYTFEITSASDGSVVTPIPADNTTPGYSATFSNLAGGFAPDIEYTITVTSTVNDCSAVVSQIITQPTEITGLTATVTDFACTAGNTVNTARIVVTGVTGGTGSYIYEFINDATSTVVQKGPSNELVWSDPAGGNFTINVYDQNNCPANTNATIAPFIELDSITATPTDPTCTTDGQIVVDVTLNPSTGTANLTYELFNATDMSVATAAVNPIVSTNDQETFTGVGVGNYVIRVTNDDTGCFIETTTQLRDPDTFDLDIDIVSDVDCFNTTTGVVDITIVDTDTSNGDQAGQFTYTITGITDPGFTASGTSSGINAQVNSLPEGEYTVTATLTGVPECSVTDTFNILGPEAELTATAIVTDITCLGNDGVIEITATGGWGDYSYYVSTTNIADPTDATLYTAGQARWEGLTPGTYYIYVMDANGCYVDLGTEVLEDPQPITADIIASNANCDGNNGEITVNNILGGQGSNYTIQLIKDGVPYGAPQTGMSAVFTGLGAGEYTAEINDQWSCQTTLTAPVTLYDAFTLSYNIDKQISCEAPVGGQITITPAGGSGNFNYSVELPDATTVDNGNNNVFSGLDQAGTYTFTVEDLDTGCIETIEVILNDPVIPIIDTIETTNVTCVGSDGTITVNLDPATETDPPYTYELSQGGAVVQTNTDGIFTGLDAGTYDVTVTSALGCEVTGTATIGTDPTPQISLSVTDNCDPAGGYDITVTLDQAGIAPYNLSVNGAIRNITFDTNNQYVITGLTAGSYDIQILDANNCGDTANNNIEIIPLDFNAQVTELLDCETPDPAGNAEITIRDISGSGSYEYEITGPSGLTRTSLDPAGATWNGADVAGDYIVTVYDLNGNCSVSKTVTVPERLEPEMEITYVDDVTCAGGSDGTIHVRAIDNGIGPFIFEITAVDGSAATIAPTSSTGYTAIFDGLTGTTTGTIYTITATAANSCVVSEDQVITEPDPVDITDVNVSQFLCTVGNITEYALIEVDTAQITGGSGTYTRFEFIQNGTVLQDGSNPQLIYTDLNGGTITVNVYDSNGCMDSIVAVIDPFTGISDPVVTVETAVTCDTGESIRVDVTVTPATATPNLQYIIEDSSGNVVHDSGIQNTTSYTFFDLVKGGYYITVLNTDTGCEVNTVHNVLEPNTFALTARQESRVACYDTPSGSVELTVVDTYLADGDQSGSFSYSIVNINDASISFSGTSTGNSIVVNGLPAGTYTASAILTDNNQNCLMNPTSFNISQSLAPLSVVSEEVANVTCTNDKGEIYVNPDGGYAPYDITIVNNLTGYTETATDVNGFVFIGLGEGTYDISVIDDGGCEITDQVTLVRPEFIQAEIEKTDVLCFDTNTGEVRAVNVTGGTGPEGWFFVLKNHDTGELSEPQDNGTFSDLPVGTYSIIIDDSWSCYFETEPITVGQPNLVEIVEVDKPALICYGESNGYYQAHVSGGIAPYTATLTNVDTGDVVETQTNVPDDSDILFSSLSGDVNYQITVVDSNGCEQVLPFMIPEGPDLTAQVEVIEECVDNSATNRIRVTLVTTEITVNDVLYALNSTDINDATMFDYVDGDAGIVENLAPGADQFITIFYEGCQQMIPDDQRFTINEIDPVIVVDASDPNTMNLIEVNASGGVPPYSYYFNDKYQGSDNTYYLSSSDPGYTDASGAEIKQITVVVTDALGCSHEIVVEKEFIDIDIPDYFTPDGDSYNDTWGPDNDEGFPEIRTRIYDRYGRMVAEIRVGEKWDGRYKGQELPTGDYWYVIKLEGNDEREFMGHFTLMR
ncbi:T9SS type B sorting domain-containing protein [Zhouia amylolytica]|uniref:T9SS type B sorting domain-containing protein n=1 Tax=Zhouia amylolytica TaxID=376730 RepID=UPI0020CF739D|nr:T9SS type B sorting domain-containing protein [Zhouia amylolytica]MCQ0112847.1 T9SS type B sorting domain-containing protein [Zhouia amylolytica]